jgi:hypothetical protein
MVTSISRAPWRASRLDSFRFRLILGRRPGGIGCQAFLKVPSECFISRMSQIQRNWRLCVLASNPFLGRARRHQLRGCRLHSRYPWEATKTSPRLNTAKLIPPRMPGG